MKNDRFPLGRFVRPRVDDARLARQWSNIEERINGSSRTHRMLPRIAAVVAFALIVLIVSIRRPVQAPSAVDGAVLETPTGQEQTLTLPEGSRIALEGGTRVRLAHVATHDVRIELERGAVRLAVTHVDGRAFVVVAKEVAVRVVGTRFRVSIDDAGDHGTVGVAVEEGRVAVSRGDVAAATISAGETWSMVFGVATAPSATSAALAPASSSATPAKKLLLRRRLPAAFHDRFREGDYAGAFAALEGEDVTALVKDLNAADLLQLSVAARLSGHPNRAALCLDRLRKHFRDDPRAGIAALDLGRLRLDELNDPRGALDALDDAIVLPLSAGLKEDAEARRVQALDKLDDVDACITARDEYLLRHPDGVHRTTVARRCKAP